MQPKRTKYIVLSKHIGVVETVITAEEYMRPLVETIRLLGNMPEIPPLWLPQDNRFTVKRITRLNLNVPLWQNPVLARA